MTTATTTLAEARKAEKAAREAYEMAVTLEPSNKDLHARALKAWGDAHEALEVAAAAAGTVIR